MNVFDFDIGDLSKNRNNQLSQHQLSKLRRLRIESNIVPISLAIFFGGGFIVELYNLIARTSTSTSLPTLVFLFAGMLLFLYLTVSRWIKLTQDIVHKKVKVTQGKITTGGAETRNVGFYSTGFRVNLNGLVFIVPSAARSVLVQGKLYASHPTPTNHKDES
ncbi:MAG: hypothetical protein ABI947_27090 [Chloroflexota bacterium]